MYIIIIFLIGFILILKVQSNSTLLLSTKCNAWAKSKSHSFNEKIKYNDINNPKILY